jgi:3-methyladenine DNA glycosylase AlkD
MDARWQGTVPLAHTELIAAVRRELAARADPRRAPEMQRYAKSELPCYGVAATPMRAACRAAVAAHPLDSFAVWRDTALTLWRDAGHREERYAAIELAGARRYRGWLTPDTLPMLEEMVVTGAWWDLADGIAPHLLGDLLHRFPAEIRPAMLSWAADEDIWKRRSAIICQLAFKGDTDLDLLERCIEPSLERREFFLRKAIGWALRQHARVDPEWVRAYVAGHADRLSPLSKREALRHIG